MNRGENPLRINELEAKLKQNDVEAINLIAEKLGSLSVHAGVVGCSQGASKAKIGGEGSENPPEIKGLKGNYRLYGSIQTYDHPEIDSADTDEKNEIGFGVGELGE